MAYLLFKSFFLAILLTIATSITAPASSFYLPSDAVIEIQTFVFPEQNGEIPGRDLAASLQEQLVFYLQQAGFTVNRTQKVHPLANSNSLTVTPLAEEGFKTKDGPDDAGQPLNIPTAAASPIDETTETVPGKELSQPSGDASEDALPDVLEGKSATVTENEPESIPGDIPDSTDLSASGTNQSVPENGTDVANGGKIGPAVYTLAGRVTLLRERVGAPTRIGSGIRIRTESVIHCAYRIVDQSGNVLVSATTSGSAAQVTANAQNVDDTLASLTEKVIRSAAQEIAARISGTDPGAKGTLDKSYYQDSPGKRLKTAP